MRRCALLALAAGVVLAATAGAAGTVRVSLVGARPALRVGQAWNARLTVRPASFTGAVRVSAKGPKRLSVRAIGGRGSYRARLVFPAPGTWTLTARAGTSTSRLGSVRVTKAAPTPLAFVWPTSVAVEPSGSLLIVENGLLRLLRVDPATGRKTVVASLTKPFAVQQAPSGAVFVTDGPLLRRIEGTGPGTVVAQADSDIGPIAIAPNGDVYYTTETRLWKLAGGTGTPVRIAPETELSTPHGLGVTAEGDVLVADTNHGRILRVGLTGAVTTFAQLESPRGMDVAADGTVYVAGRNRVIRLDPSGKETGVVGPVFDDPYDVEFGSGGVLWVVESLQSGRLRRVAPDGTVTTLSRR